MKYTSTLTLAFATLFAACSKQTAENGEATYATQGVIQMIDIPRLTISHEDIPGYMPAMTMVFEVESPETARHLAVGDVIDFTFLPEGDGAFIIKSLAKNNTVPSPQPNEQNTKHNH